MDVYIYKYTIYKIILPVYVIILLVYTFKYACMPTICNVYKLDDMYKYVFSSMYT